MSRIRLVHNDTLSCEAILRKMPDGKSYARDIAEKYGLSLDRLLSKIKK